MIKIFIPSHDLDSITRAMFAELKKSGHFDIIIAGPGEIVEAPAIRSKLGLGAIHNYRKLLKKFHPDITFSPSTSGLSTMLAASVGLGIKNVGYRGTQAKVRRSDPFNYLALLNPRVCHVVCETHDIEETLSKQIGKYKVSTSTKPYMLEWAEDGIKNPAPYPGHNIDSLKLITVGMFEGRPHKGLSTLLEAMKLLKGRPVELTVVGSVSNSDKETAPDSVTFTGPRKDVVNLMASHEIYVLPSLRDASPRTLREAQAVGLPCIVSDIPGARDLIIPEETGLLVPPSNSTILAETINELIENPEIVRRMSENTRPYIRDHFSMEDYVNYHANLFESLLK